MALPSTLLVYACWVSCCTVTFGAIYISPSKDLIEQGDTFEINCTVKPLSNDVQFFLDGTPHGDCTGTIPGISAGTCSAGIVQDIATEETTLTIASASIFTDQGLWKCTHNAESAETSVNINNFQTVLNNNQYELTSVIETSSSPNSEFKVFVGCGSPQPTVTWTLDKCDGSQTGIAVDSPALTTNTSAGCTSPLVAYTSAIKASALASPTVETCYIPKATMTYSEKPSVMHSSQFTSQVQFPGAYSTSTLTTSTNSSVLPTGSTISTTLSSSTCTQLQSSKECCFIVYILPFTKWICIIFYVLMSLVCMVIVIIIICLCYWRRQLHHQNNTTGNNSARGSNFSAKRRRKGDTSPIGNLNPIALPNCLDVRHKGHQNEMTSFKNKTGRHPENTGLKNKDHTLQENGTTYM